MKNIYEILKSIGLEIPEDKKESFEKEMVANYKTIKEVENIQVKVTNAEAANKKLEADLQQRDKDLADLNKQLEDVGNDKAKIDEVTTKLQNLQSDYDEQQKKYSKQLADQRYEFAIKELSSDLKFSSNSAKKAFINDLMDNRLSMKDNEILGFKDFVDKYKEQDAGAFMKEEPDDPEPNKPKPKFVDKNKKIDDPDVKKEPKERPLIW